MHNSIAAIGAYLGENLVQGLRTSPLRAPAKAWIGAAVFALLALAIGFGSGTLRVDVVATPPALLLPFTILVFPSLIEEAFFRGVLIPRRTIEHGPARTAAAIAWSTLIFVLAHPLAALTFNPEAIPVFLDPAMLAIVALLGVSCGYGYAVSQSLWVPVAIHWAAVVCWVLLFGGHELVMNA